MIQTDAQAIESRYGGAPKSPPTSELQEIGKPSIGIPQGQPIPEGTVIQQIVGRGMAVVPPQQPGPPAPSMAVVPPQPTNRTSIGTFVESPYQGGKPPIPTNVLPDISKTVSNPMTASPVAPPSGIVDAPVQEPKPKPKKRIDLALAILDHIHELGGEKSEAAQKFYDRSEQAMKMWLKNPGQITLESINRFLDKRPGIGEVLLEQLEPHFALHDGGNGTQSLPNRGKTDVVVCAPVLGQPTLPFLWVLVYLAKKYEVGFDIQADTMIARSRNMLAKRFLESGATWSLWLDSDMAAPIANADWFRWITTSTTVSNEACNFDVLARLLGHSKAIVGGVYASRRYQGRLVMQPEIRPRNQEDKLLCNDLRKGYRRGMVEVDWIGFGCAMVHRQVFLEIQHRFPQLAPSEEFAPWRYFQTDGDEGEDEAFCKRARQCAIPIWLDTDLVCGHIGSMCFLPEHTAPVPGI